MIDGPYVVAALICEKVLTEQDGVPSAIRIVDRINVQPIQESYPNATSPIRPAAVPMLSLFIGLKGGGLKQTSVVVDLVAPSGRLAQVATAQVRFNTENEGANIYVQFLPGFNELGLHWFDIKCDGRLVTRTPLEVVALRESQPSESPNSSSPGAGDVRH